MQIWHTLESMAYQNIHDEIIYDGTPLSNVCQHVENYQKPRGLHPTWSYQNQKSELTFDLFYHTWTELQDLMQQEKTHNLPETSKDG